MIYISTSCIKSNSLKESIQTLVDDGYSKIELSGGAEYYPDLESNLKAISGIDFLCHNYFPPPKDHFVLNLASLDTDTFERSLPHYQNPIELSKKIGSAKFGLHAGFLIDIKPDELGKKIAPRPLFEKELALERFCDGFKKLQAEAGDVRLYIENNVFSKSNKNAYEGQNPFLLTSKKEYEELKTHINFHILLDVGHLKVSSNSLGLDFDTELSALINETDYIHISDNDGLHDQNNPIKPDSSLFHSLSKHALTGKTLTLEVYTGRNDIKRSYECLNSFQ